MRVAARSSCEAGRLALATDPIGSILQRYSDALIPEARCRAARLCLEGSKSRNRLSEVPAWPVLFFGREPWVATARAGHTKRFARRSSRCDSSGPMTSRWLMTLQVVVPPPQKLGAVPHGTRVIAPITSGTFEGPRLRGRVLPGGGDWTLLRSDAVLELDLRITLETDDGALISMTRSEEHTSELQSQSNLVCRL